MNTHDNVALFCASGIVQYADSIEAMLLEYNRSGRNYEVRTGLDGSKVLYHKGHNRSVGTFKTKLPD